MERNIPSLLLFHFVFFVLLTPPCAATSGLNISKVVRISWRENWWGAQAYCRKYHSDLVTIRNAQDNNKTAIFKGWIGLTKWSDGVWKWSSGGEISRFFSWDSGEPDQGELCAIKYSRSLKWRSRYCSHTQPFLCMDERLILVQERKTWEEALQHCRRLQRTGSTSTKYLYDLISLPEAKSRLLYGETTRLNVTMNEVWVGLRFLAGEWFWMSRDKVTSSYLPPCPGQEQHCGALVLNSTQWKIMNCSEKRKFLCSIRS